MPRKLEYDFSVQPPNRASAAGFVFLLLLALGFLGLLSATASAQVNGMPASVTSPGFGGRQVNGVAPSVTSLGPRGFTPASPTCCFKGTSLGQPHFTTNQTPPPDFHHRRHDRNFPWGSAFYPVPYYGYYDSGDDAATDASGEQYNGGPTIFDRRGSGTPPIASAPYPSARTNSPQADSAIDAAEQSETTSASDQPQTVLIFKDGHQVEVANYAIVGSTLYDLTGGHRQKIALADLNLTATAKENDDRGIDFQLPAASQAN